MAKKGSQDLTLAEANKDRYPDFAQVLSRIQSESDALGKHVERLEIYTLPNGEATYRVWLPRADEPLGGYLPPE